MKLSKREKKLVSLLLGLLAVTLAAFLVILPGMTNISMLQQDIEISQSQLDNMQALMDQKSTIDANLISEKEKQANYQTLVIEKRTHNQFHAYIDTFVTNSSLRVESFDINATEVENSYVVNLTLVGDQRAFRNFIENLNSTDQSMYITSFNMGDDSETYRVSLAVFELEHIQLP
ncbi:MAG: hypothetical protein ACRCZJ_05400 [Erysipelotrichaceae bacterium]